MTTLPAAAPRIGPDMLRAERWRLPTARVGAVLVILLIVLTDHAWPQGAAIDVAAEVGGFVLLLACAAGRVWSLLYIAGRKTSSLVDEGPYSLVRHPLYVSTALGSIGVGLASENIVALGAIVLFTVVCYWPVVRAEESRLTAVHGDAYREYQRRVPQLIPRFRGLREPAEITVNPRVFRRGATEAVAIVLIYMGLQMIEGLHGAGVLPVLARFG